jgi:hypothetical protein
VVDDEFEVELDEEEDEEERVVRLRPGVLGHWVVFADGERAERELEKVISAHWGGC